MYVDAPTLYTSSLGMSEEMALSLGAFTQLWYLLASFVTWYTIDRVGRRKLFIIMALGMAVVLVGEAICVGLDTKSAAIGAVVFVFLFEACFTWGWMATVWIYPAEILPLKTRAKGASLAAAADFLGNFLVVEVTPVGVRTIGYKFYIVWAVLNVVNAVVVFLFYPETGGLQLEAIEHIFTTDLGEEDIIELETDRRFYRKLQWNVVDKAAAAVKQSKDIHALKPCEASEAQPRRRTRDSTDTVKDKGAATHVEHISRIGGSSSRA